MKFGKKTDDVIKEEQSSNKANLSFGEGPEKSDEMRELNGHFNIFKEPCFCPDYSCNDSPLIIKPSNRQGNSPLMSPVNLLNSQ